MTSGAPLNRTRSLQRAWPILLALALALAACSRGDAPADSAGGGSDGASVRAALTVTTIRPTLAEWPLALSANGNIAAWQEASVGAEVSGLRVSEIRVSVGDAVKRGQELARLAQAAVEVDLAQQRAAIAEAEALLADARVNAERARKLEQTGAISAQQINQLLTAERTAEARLELARARLRADQLRLDHTRVVAPDDGVISARSAMLGAVVQAGQELFRLIRKGRLEWRAEVTANELARIEPGQSVAIEAANGAKTTGTVRVIAPTVDVQTRVAIVYVDLPADSGASAGMFARGEFDLGRRHVTALPQEAVLRREGFDYVFLIEDGARVKLTKVETGRRRAEHVEILSALPGDAQAVASGVAFLNDGDRVRIAAEPAR